MRKRKLVIVVPLVCIVALVGVLLVQGGPPVLTDDAYVHIYWAGETLKPRPEHLLVYGTPQMPSHLSRTSIFRPTVTVTKAGMREILATLSPKMKKGEYEGQTDMYVADYVTPEARWHMPLYPTQATFNLLRKVQNCLSPEKRYAMDDVMRRISPA